MAPLNIYDASIGLFISGQNTLLDLLKKAAATAEADSIPAARLCEDMLPLTFQVQATSNTSKKAIGHLTGNVVEAWEDNEKTFPELIARVEKTLALLKSIDPKSVIGVDEKIIDMPLGKRGTFKVPVSTYVLGFAIPNYFFHLNTAYSILRHKGVEIGKFDYLGPFIGPLLPAPEPAAE